MINENDINNFFISKKDIYCKITKYHLILTTLSGEYEHDCFAPETIEELNELYEKVKKELNELEKNHQENVEKIEENLDKGIVARFDSKDTNCGGCRGKEIKEINNETWGLGNLAKAIASGVVSEGVSAYRFEKCKSCEIRDIEGSKLFHEEDGVFYCGIPRLSELAKIKRDERHWGCGCDLKDKVKYLESECPFKVW